MNVLFPLFLFLFQEPHIPVYSIATRLLDALRLKLGEKNTGWIWRVGTFREIQPVFGDLSVSSAKILTGGTDDGKYFQ